MNALQKLKLVWYSLLLLMCALLFGLPLLHSEAVSRIDMQLLEGVEEHEDRVIPFLTKEKDRAPDYRLEYRVEGRWETARTKLNTSAVDALTFPINSLPNRELISELRVSDQDTIESDPLEVVAVTGDVVKGDMFEFRIETAFSYNAGMAWFFQTAIGKFIGIALVVVILIIILAYVPIWF